MKTSILAFTFSILCICYAIPGFTQPEFELDTTSKSVKVPDHRGFVELQAIQTGNSVPFWMRSLQFGSIPVEGTSISVIGGYARDYQSDGKKPDFGYGLRVRGNLGKEIQASLLEAYAKMRFRSFELKAGRFRSVQGLVDSTLGLGSFTYSGNTIPIPMVQLTTHGNGIPVMKGFIHLRGTYAQGWMGQTPTNFMNSKKDLQEYLHQKSLAITFGKPTSSFRLSLGFVHQVQWVDNTKLKGDSVHKLSPFSTYVYLVTGKDYVYKPGFNATTNIGNHVGSVDVAVDIAGATSDVRIYREFFYDSENSFTTSSLKDGITGMSITNRSPATSGSYFKKLVVEFLNSTNQSYGVGKSGHDNYYNHYEITDGLSYQQETIGTPFITPKQYMRQGTPSMAGLYTFFKNTRVKALHVGVEWGRDKLFFRNRISYSRNLGMYETANIFSPSNQLSLSMEAAMPIKQGWQARALLAVDAGKLLYNSAGGFLSIIRMFE